MVDENEFRRVSGILLDSIYNTATGQGVLGRDPALCTTIAAPPILSRGELSNLYIGSDVARNLVNIPQEDIWRNGVIIKTKDDNQTKELTAEFAESGAVKALEDWETSAQVYGGSCLWPGVSAKGRLEDPIDDATVIQSVDFFEIFNRYELITNPQPSRTPETYDLVDNQDLANNKPGRSAPRTRIHSSRMLRRVPYTISRFDSVYMYQGWGPSLFTTLWLPIRGYLAAWAATEDLLRSFAQAYFSIKNLANLAAENNITAIQARIDAMLAAQSTMGAMLLDADSEEYGRQSTPITGLPELHDRYQSRLSHAARVPQTLLFGQSPGGMNATGESDIRLYYARIKSLQMKEISPNVKKLANLYFRSLKASTKGKVPEFEIVFPPLWEESRLEKADTRKKLLEGDFILKNIGAVTAHEVANSRMTSLDNFEIIPDPEAQALIKERDMEMLELPVVDPNAPAPAANVSGSRGTSKETDAPAAKGAPVPKSGLVDPAEKTRHTLSGQ